MVKIIDQIMFKLLGKSVPVVRVSEVENNGGLIHTLTYVGLMKDRPNSLVNSFDVKGYEKAKNTTPIVRVSDKGIADMCWVVSERGQTVNLYTQPWKGPNLEDVIGKAATADDIADAMDMNKSSRQLWIGIVIGIGIWMIVGPLISAAMS